MTTIWKATASRFTTTPQRPSEKYGPCSGVGHFPRSRAISSGPVTHM